MLLTGYAVPVSAQDADFIWARGIGSVGQDFGNGVAVDGKGNVYVTGTFYNDLYFNYPTGTDTIRPIAGTNTDVFLAKYDIGGNLIWAKAMGGPSADHSYGIAVDGMGNAYVTGYFGNRIQGTEMYFKHSTGIDTLRATGENTDVFIAKYDASGNYQWAKNMGGTSNDYGYGVTVDDNGNAYVTGQLTGGEAYFNNNRDTLRIAVGGSSAFIAKYDANGNYQWARGADAATGRGIATDGNGNVYTVGFFRGTAYFNHTTGTDTLRAVRNNDVFIAKYDSSGNYKWAKSMGGTGQDAGYGVATDGVGNVYITGNFPSTIYFNHSTGVDTLRPEGGFSDDVFIVKYDSNGNYLWAKSMGTSGGQDFGYGIAVDGTGNAYVTGRFGDNVRTEMYFRHSTGIDTLRVVVGPDAFVAKYDAGGNYQWAKGIGGPGDGDVGQGVAVDAIGNVYVTGAGTKEMHLKYNTGVTDTLKFTETPVVDAFIIMLGQGCHYITSVESACDSFIFNKITYTESGIYTSVFTSVENCDSIVTLNLTITGHASVNPVISGHYCDSVTFNRETYTSSGTYVQRHTNTEGCDSSITYDITIGQSSPNFITESACDSFILNDSVYTVSGTYRQVFNNVTGCDSSITLELIINNTPLATVARESTLLIAGVADTYQWLDCANSFAPIPNAVTQTFIPAVSGSYAVVIASASGCSDTSDCITVELDDNSIREQEQGIVRLYPNPTDSRLTIQTQKTLKNATIRLMNIVGQSLAEQVNQHGTLFVVDMKQYAAGVYFVEINEGDKRMRMKAVKE